MPSLESKHVLYCVQRYLEMSAGSSNEGDNSVHRILYDDSVQVSSLVNAVHTATKVEIKDRDNTGSQIQLERAEKLLTSRHRWKDQTPTA